MSNGITKGLTDILGIDTNAGTSEMQAAIDALAAVGVPTAEQLNLPELQKYVSAGVLTPEQYQAIMADPEAYSNTIASKQDNSGLNAQKSALEQLSTIINSGGSTAINKANLQDNLDQTNQTMQAARGGIESDAKQRGVYGGGLEFISKLMNEQSGAENANKGAVQAASNNAKLALEALTQSGNLGSTMQGQSNQNAQAQAQAAQQIAEYNSQLQSSANQYNTNAANAAQAANLTNAQDIGNMNTQNANYRTQYNAAIPQTLFQDEMAKAGGISNAYGNMGQLKQGQAAQDAALTGSVLGSGASFLAGAPPAPKKKAQPDSYMNYAHGGEVNEQGRQCYAEGGEVHDHQLCMAVGGSVPGGASPMDDEANDTVEANLSPGEIVLPNSVTQSPNAPQEAQQFVQETKGMQPTAGSFAEIIQNLEENGLELRLGAK